MITCLSALAVANEATFFDKAVQESRHAIASKSLLESDGHILMRDGFLAGKEFGEASLNLRLLCIELPSIRHLIDIKASHFGQQLAVRTEQDAVHADILAVIVAVHLLDAALQRKTESADARQRDGVAPLEFMGHNTLKNTQSSL